MEAAASRLAAAGVPSPRADAEALVGQVTSLSRSDLVLARGRVLTDAETTALEDLVARRAAREPLQWVLGTAHFHGLELRVRPGALVPRPETERLVEIVLDAIAPVRAPAVVDVGTGTGAIALALKAARPDATLTGTDPSRVALALAAENAAVLGLAVELLEGSLLAGRTGLDAVVSNPPYLPEGDAAILEPEVRAEPAVALFAGADGLAVARPLVIEAAGALRPGGLLALELDPRNLRVLASELDPAVWTDVRVEPDLAGRERFLLARTARPTSTAA